MKKMQTYSRNKKGYILLLVMLLLGSMGLYLSYNMSRQKTKIQSWELEKTGAEMTYWLDIQYNYAQDQGSLLSIPARSNVSLLDLVNNNYLPYGQSRYVSIPSASISKVSEFMCSPFPGITSTDGLKSPDSYPTCPSGTDPAQDQHCSLDTPAYYSCSTTMSTNNTADIANAQYYVNANYIAPGNISNILSGLGLIIRTPGKSVGFVTTNNGLMGLLPANSPVQALISMLPTSSFNVYPTNIPQVNGIGVGTYVYDSTRGVVKNDRYSKIIDMGLVQSVGLDKLPTSCYGWTNGQKTGTGTYTESRAPSEGTNNAKNDPPVCIRIDTTKYGPAGSVERCDRIDVLYTMFNDWQPADKNYWYLNYTTAKVKLNPPYEEVYLSIHIDPTIAYGSYNVPLSYLYSSNPARRNYLAYLVRCTRNNPL